MDCVNGERVHLTSGSGGAACVSFLFRSRLGGSDPAAAKAKLSKEDSEQRWHRWTSNDGFLPGSGWHHVAVTYTFGKGASVKGYLDGVEVKGKWDMGGQSDAAPVVDNDDVWLGSSMGAQAGSTFNGLINEVAIHRRALEPARVDAPVHALERRRLRRLMFELARATAR
mgnify:CR=1 FL=1